MISTGREHKRQHVAITFTEPDSKQNAYSFDTSGRPQPFKTAGQTPERRMPLVRSDRIWVRGCFKNTVLRYTFPKVDSLV